LINNIIRDKFQNAKILVLEWLKIATIDKEEPHVFTGQIGHDIINSIYDVLIDSTKNHIRTGIGSKNCIKKFEFETQTSLVKYLDNLIFNIDSFNYWVVDLESFLKKLRDI
jgi:hypothetical protein